MKMLSSINFCRNCLNFVERRDIEGFAACARNHKPRVACNDFKPRRDSPIFAKRGMGFCLYCENLVVVGDITACARNHRPRIACDDFKDAASILRKLASIRRLEIASIRTMSR
ncbi:TPA: hypothetical protein EYP26_02000 [Candidatus Bathyarchaeota archaeon]|nr:hypothetical protein [Candidatus Bathyarchaeota archaeon]